MIYDVCFHDDDDDDDDDDDCFHDDDDDDDDDEQFQFDSRGHDATTVRRQTAWICRRKASSLPMAE